jgi:hypothetical protein
MPIHDYLIDISGFDWPRLLATWLWLLPERVSYVGPVPPAAKVERCSMRIR